MSRSPLGQFRQEFWSHVEADWVPEGWAGGNVRCPTADLNLYISLYVAWQGVGAYLVHTHLRDPKLPKMVKRYRQPLSRELRENVTARGGTFRRVEGGTRDRASWDDMAKWLHRRQATYQRVIDRIVNRS